MRFELTVALKYLIPRWRQLSVSIISLISILVISLVVWLVVVFLSVTEGIEKKWVEELVSLNAPVRMTPTDDYYRSYYYQIDGLSFNSNYTTKSIGEKLIASLSDPYDLSMDAELPLSFPQPERHLDGTFKDPVKEGWEIASSFPFVRPQEYEVSFGNLRLGLLREEEDNLSQTYITQVSYLASHDKKNVRFQDLILPPNSEDLNNLLFSLTQSIQWDDETQESPLSTYSEPTPQEIQKNLESFFNNIEVTEVKVDTDLFVFPKALYPQSAHFKGIGVIGHGGEIRKVVLPQKNSDLSLLNQKLSASGHLTVEAEVIFKDGVPEVRSNFPANHFPAINLDSGTTFKSRLDLTSLEKAVNLSSVQIDLDGKIQDVSISGKTPFDPFRIAKASIKESPSSPFWVYNECDSTGVNQCVIPKETPLGDGLLLSKHFLTNGVKIGDRGTLSYYTPTTSSMQEQRLPIYVAGFYDPGLMPIGSKLIFADPGLISQLRGNFNVQDQMLGNGINIWLSDLTEAENVKQKLKENLLAKEIAKYWKVESYHDYEFAKPVLQQLESDKTLFTLIAIIILIVACSNIISMLILLVNDKKREIGIMQSMGASSRRIAMIFGICGFVTGLISSILGTTAAIFTLSRLQSLVDFLSFLQGHEAFQAAFYGSKLPNELSYHALGFVLLATLIISILAGMIPAIKAARIRPSDILRTE